jgi:hypothetical protein
VAAEFRPGSSLACDGVFRGEEVEGKERCLRTSATRQAIHAGAFVEPI